MTRPLPDFPDPGPEHFWRVNRGVAGSFDEPVETVFVSLHRNTVSRWLRRPTAVPVGSPGPECPLCDVTPEWLADAAQNILIELQRERDRYVGHTRQIEEKNARAAANQYLIRDYPRTSGQRENGATE